ncbi:hypothetical protein SOASR032_12490 [Pragia fontium]|uniref:DUF2877 domain-containing protein n=1 Tax=Pragia fontium TaxID=82985 RepID=A0ABQ5LGL7_9GAMM|nr:DUF2877 domain-containing protein [Pragia fontium]GKX62680.1 hypothetical protein SOASR032_12490 [Pragia fontium]
MQQNRIRFSPLATSQHISLIDGEVKCHSIYSKAINLVLANGQLLTLQHGVQAMSPFGMVLQQDDFCYLADSLLIDQVGTIQQQQIILDDMQIDCAERRLSLKAELTGTINGENLQQAMVQHNGCCGLYGDLAGLVSSRLNDELLALQQGFVRWLSGESVSWQSFVGKGPGLTPSMDDTLVGMLLTAYSDRRLSHRLKQLSFFSQEEHQRLELLTTIVSVNYLSYAARGIFATPSLRLSRAMVGNSQHKMMMSVSQLLTSGHHSGADTLLGVWLGYLAINDYFSQVA